MNQEAVLLVCTVLAALCSHVTCHELSHPVYLDFSCLVGDRYPETIPLTYQTLQRIGQRYAASDGQRSFDAVINEISDEGVEGYENIVIQQLLEIIYEPYLTKNIEITMMKMCAILSDPGKQDVSMFVGLVLTEGRRLFNYQAVWRAIIHLSRHLTHPNRNLVMSSLDEFLKQILNFDTTFDEQEFLNQLAGLDLTRDTLNIGPLKHVDARKIFEGETLIRRSRIDIFMGLMKLYCNDLRDEYYQSKMNVITLAFTVGDIPLDTPFLIKKLIEYNRLCVSVDRDEGEIRVNLRRILDELKQSRRSFRRVN